MSTDNCQAIKDYLKKLVLIVFIALTIMSASTVLTWRTAQTSKDIATKAKEISTQNRTFLGNFSDYMRCLVVTDQKAVEAYGLEPYFNLCDDLLFRNTGLVPTHTKISIPSTTTTVTGPTPTGP